ncbi:MAG: hypothetical protein HKN71_13075 [Gemmatimonadetes bacterium]|nr:hypothetical protein [Gemmatimonadota bacterium]
MRLNFPWLVLPFAILTGCGDTGTESEPEPPRVVVGASSAALTAPAAASGAPVSVAVSNGGEGTISGLTATIVHAAGEPDGWLTATLSATSTPATLELAASALPLSGSYTATVTVGSAVPSEGSADIEVTLTVEPRPLLYIVDQQNDVLRRLDPSTLEIDEVGALGYNMDFGDCSYDPDGRRLYATDGRGNLALYTVDLATGAATQVGVHGVAEAFSLEYHPPSGVLFITDRTVPRTLYRLDKTTAVAAAVGEVGLRISALAWDGQRQTLVGQTTNVGPAGAALYTIDLASAVLTQVATSPSINNHGMTYDLGEDRIWAADLSGRLVRFDPGNGYAATSVATGLGQNVCIAYVP